jgi:hypothetical protein
MSNFYTTHTIEELDEMHPCERHNMCGELDLGPCGLCYGSGWWTPMFSNGEPCPNIEQNEANYQEWKQNREQHSP